MNIIESIKHRLKNGLNPFPFQRFGMFNLVSTIIPKSQVHRVAFVVDHLTADFLNDTALSSGLTTHELLRQLVWHLRSEIGTDQAGLEKPVKDSVANSGRLLQSIVKAAEAKKQSSHPNKDSLPQS